MECSTHSLHMHLEEGRKRVGREGSMGRSDDEGVLYHTDGEWAVPLCACQEVWEWSRTSTLSFHGVGVYRVWVQE